MTSRGIPWEYLPRRFPLLPPFRSYSPDFFLPKQRRYVEVVGSSQAFRANERKYEAFRRQYPDLAFEVVNASGAPYSPPNKRARHQRWGLALCDVCGRQFTRLTAWQKRCSASCRDAYHNAVTVAAKRAWRKAHPNA